MANLNKSFFNVWVIYYSSAIFHTDSEHKIPAQPLEKVVNKYFLILADLSQRIFRSKITCGCHPERVCLKSSKEMQLILISEKTALQRMCTYCRYPATTMFCANRIL